MTSWEEAFVKYRKGITRSITPSRNPRKKTLMNPITELLIPYDVHVTYRNDKTEVFHVDLTIHEASIIPEKTTDSGVLLLESKGDVTIIPVENILKYRIKRVGDSPFKDMAFTPVTGEEK